MKKKWMKLTAIVCTLTMVAGMTPAAFADTTDYEQEEPVAVMNMEDDSIADEDRDSQTAEELSAQEKEEVEDEVLTETDDILQDEVKSPEEDTQVREDEITVDAADDAGIEETDGETSDLNESDLSKEEKDLQDMNTAEEKNDSVLKAASAGDITFTLKQNSFTYTGSEIKPEVKEVIAKDNEGKSYTLTSAQYDVTYTNNVNAGNAAKVVVAGKGQFEDYFGQTYFTIAQADIGAPVQLSLSQTSFTYTGSAMTPVVSGIFNSYSLTKDKDFTVAYYNNVNAGTATVAVQGIGNFKGNANMIFTIAKADQAMNAVAASPKIKLKKTTKINVTGNRGNITFQSSKPAVASVTAKGVVTGKKTGSVVITVTAAGDANYNQAVKSVKITVIGKELTGKNTKVKLSKTSYTYNGKKRKPSVKVTFKGKKLKNNTDYKVSYKNNLDAGKATVQITGVNKYSGTIKKTFKIKQVKNTLKASINKTSVEIKKTAQIKVAKASGPVTFSSDNKKIATVSETGLVTGVKTGNCTITVTAAGDVNHKKATKKFKLSIGVKDLGDPACKVVLSKDEYVYDGTSKRPGVTVKYNGQKLKQDKDYTVTYYDNQNAGEGKVYIKAKGTYKGSRTVTFTINKATQTDFKISLANNHIPYGGKARVIATNARGGLTYGSYSPSYARSLGDGWFQGLKKTQNYVTITATAAGNENYKSRTIEMRVQIY